MNRILLRTYVVSILLLAVSHISAQKLTVEAFNAASTDISASKYPRNDLNGNPCGLVKVQLAMPGAQFEGNVIEPVENKTGEYWVYMTEGSKELVVKTPETVPLHLTFADYQLAGISPKATYVLTLSAPIQGKDRNSQFQYLVLTVNPRNSIVYIDDQIRPVEDGSASALLPRGVHSYKVECPGYDSETGTVNIGSSRKVVEVTLRSNQAQLTVTCPTAGAEVWLNEQLCGNVPASTSLPPGNYVVEVRKAGFRVYRETISLLQSEERQLNIPALEAEAGSLDINYQPVNAEVYIDGKRLGACPDVFSDIPVGKHKLEIRKEGYITHEETIQISEDGQTLSLSGQLRKTRKSSSSSPVSSSAKPPTGNGGASRPFVRPTSGYAQVGLQLGTLIGIPLQIGAYLHNVNVEVFYMPGLAKETVYLNYTDGTPSTEETLKPCMFGLKVGYGIAVGRRLRITPQVGLGNLNVKSDNIGSSALCGNVGCRVDYALTSFLGLDITPEGQFALSKKEAFTTLSDLSSKVKGWASGFGARLGVYVYF